MDLNSTACGCKTSNRQLIALQLGLLDYRLAWALQDGLVQARRQNIVGDILLVLEHPPVLTLGRGGGFEDLLVTKETLRQMGVDLYSTNRGGRATYHGPGQLVVYPIVKLPDRDLHRYVRLLEQAVIDTLFHFGITAGRHQRSPGVWVKCKKIAAIGIAVRGGVTMHGLALNNDPNLEHFNLIVPCGISDKGVTSIRQEKGTSAEPVDLSKQLVSKLARLYEAEVVWDFHTREKRKTIEHEEYILNKR